jgi:hypothetical protein
MKAAILASVVVLFVTCGSQEPPVPPPPSGGGPTIEKVCYSISAPFSSADVCIKSSGRIDYYAEERTGPARETYKDFKEISKAEWNDLVALIQGSDFFTLDESYEEEGLSDAPTHGIVVTTSTGEKSVSCYGACAKSAELVMQRVEKLWGREILVVGF